MRRTLLLLSFVCCCFFASAQYNLVPNYSFEDYNNCPTSISGFSWADNFYIMNWFSGSGGTSDYYNACAPVATQVSVPSNLFSLDQPARTGQAYGGFWTDLYDNNTFTYREYVQVQLTDPLVAGQCYYVEFWSAPATQSDFGLDGYATTDAIGAYFSVDKAGDGFSSDVLPYVPQVDNNGTGNYIDQPGEWTKICGYFTAEGGEEWVCIGNFHPDDEVDVVAYEGGELDPMPLVYLFVEDVLVTSTDSLAAAFLNDTVVCSPVTLQSVPCGDSYLWSTGETTQNIVVTETGEYWVHVNTSCGVLADTAEVIFVSDSTYTSDTTLQICYTELPYSLHASPAYDYYTWNTGEHTESIAINAPGIYYVTGFSSCAIFIDSFTVDVIEPLTVYPDLGNDTLVCADTWSIDLSSPPGFNTYLWSTGETDQNITVSENGNYWVQVESTCQTLYDTISITEDPYLNATIDLGPDTLICELLGATQIVLDAGDLPNYTWNTGEHSQTITVGSVGLYYVTSNTLCKTISDSLRIGSCEIMDVPNAFSPNNDAVNDVMNVFCTTCENIESFSIYNRWGQLVFETNSINVPWDGTFNGTESDMGVYVYVLKYKDGGAIKIKTGNITLVR